MRADEANATDAEVDARATKPEVKAATVAVIRAMADQGIHPQIAKHWTALVVSILVCEGFTIASDPYEQRHAPPAPVEVEPDCATCESQAPDCADCTKALP